MRFIGKYKEMNPSKDYDSIKDHFAKEKYPGQEKIVQYLLSGTIVCACLSLPRDVITGERIGLEDLGMNDGEYTWFNTLAYYVEKYNLVLPEDFVQHIMEKTQ